MQKLSSSLWFTFKCSAWCLAHCQVVAREFWVVSGVLQSRSLGLLGVCYSMQLFSECFSTLLCCFYSVLSVCCCTVAKGVLGGCQGVAMQLL